MVVGTSRCDTVSSSRLVSRYNVGRDEWSGPNSPNGSPRGHEVFFFDARVPAGGSVSTGGIVLDAAGQPLLGPDGRPVVLYDPRVPRAGSIGAGGVVLDAAGRPVLGPDGKPIMLSDSRVPHGGSIGAGGVILDAAGKRVLGEDGQAVVITDPRVPRAGSIGAHGEIMDADGRPLLGPDGKPLKAGQLPPGGSIGAYGVILDASGKPLLGADGKPVVQSDPRVPPGGSIGARGEILDAYGRAVLGGDGKPLKVAQLAPQRHLSPVDRRRQAALVAMSEARLAAAARKAKGKRKGKGKGAKKGPKHPPPSLACEVLAHELGVAPRKLDLCAVKLQARIRGKLHRKMVERYRQGQDTSLCALTLQKFARGRQGRRRVDVLWQRARALAAAEEETRAAAMVRALTDAPAESSLPLGSGAESVPFWIEHLPTLAYPIHDLYAIRQRRHTADVRVMDAEAERAVSNGGYYVAVSTSGGREKLLCRCWDVFVSRPPPPPKPPAPPPTAEPADFEQADAAATMEAFLLGKDMLASPASAPKRPPPPARELPKVSHQLDMVAILEWDGTSKGAAKVVKAETGPYALSPRSFKGIMPVSRCVDVDAASPADTRSGGGSPRSPDTLQPRQLW